jgi:hypothetical protein
MTASQTDHFVSETAVFFATGPKTRVENPMGSRAEKIPCLMTKRQLFYESHVRLIRSSETPDWRTPRCRNVCRAAMTVGQIPVGNDGTKSPDVRSGGSSEDRSYRSPVPYLGSFSSIRRSPKTSEIRHSGEPEPVVLKT